MKVNGWLQYIVTNLKPFDSWKKEDKVRYIRYSKMDEEIFMMYIELVGKRSEAKIVNALSSKFELMVDS